MLQKLRTEVGLPANGPASDLRVWLEGGPNNAPTWTEVKPNWAAGTFVQFGVDYGDVLAV